MVVLINLIVVITLQYIHISNYHIVYLKLKQCYISIISKKPGGKNQNSTNINSTLLNTLPNCDLKSLMDSLKSPGPSLEKRLDQLVLKVTLSVLTVHISVQHTSICWELVLLNFHLIGHPGILGPKICKTKISPVLFSSPSRLQSPQNWSRYLGFCYSAPLRAHPASVPLTDRLFFI